MQYPKAVMRMQELVKMGFPETFLMAAYRSRGQTFAQKKDPNKSNSPILFDTEEFDKWRIRRLKIENASLPRS